MPHDGGRQIVASTNMAKDSMTEFSRRLGEFFARTASFPDLEQAADKIVRENHDIDHALNILDRHRDSGRLPEVLHRALSDRLMGKAAPVDHDRDSTKPLADNSDDAAELTERIGADQTAEIALTDENRPALMQDHTAKLKNLIPDPTEMLQDATSIQVESDELPSDATTPQVKSAGSLADATIPQAERAALLTDATSLQSEQTAVQQAKATDASLTKSNVPNQPNELTAPLSLANEKTSDDTRASQTEAMPERGADQAQEQRSPESPKTTSYEKTLQVNSHVAPTIRIENGAPADEPHEKTRHLSDVTRPEVQRSQTQPIADVPPPISDQQIPSDKTQLIADVPVPQASLPIDKAEPATDSTLPISDVPKPDASSFDNTQAIDSGVFPSKAFPTGTASNWLRPDQWSERHTGPLGPGMVLKRRFLIERQLGRGGMGVVFKARDKRKEEANDRDPFVAVKVLNDHYRDHPQALIALQREARKAQTLAHPNIVTVYDFDRDGTTVYMTMELMRGEPLDLLLRRRKKENENGVDVELARRIIKEMAAGLAYAHKHDIIHSDFKPGNVFLTKDERVKILDFGIARASAYSGPKQSTEQTMFDAGDFSSLTPGYAALEMFQRADPHPADDVYAMAITAYLLLTGLHPFDRKTAEEVDKLGLVPEPIKHIARHEWAAIEHGLALKREDRTQDAAAFLREFSGRRKVARWATAAIFVLSIIASYFAYTSFQDPGPAIAWSELTTTQQSTFREHIASGDDWLANDPPWIGGAYLDFAAAYEIHPRNPEATRGLDTIADSLIALAGSTVTATDRQRLLGDIETASSNEYLKEHRRLRELRRELSNASSAAR